MSKHYKLPDGNVQIALSGGRSSAYMLHNILEENGGLTDRVRVVFANTGREMPETLDFVQEIGDKWNVPIVWVEYRTVDKKHGFKIVSHNSASRDGEPLIELMLYFGFTPNRAARFCSHEGKTRTAKRYCVSIGWSKWTCAVGIRGDEPSRYIKNQPKDRYLIWHPMVDAMVSKQDVMEFWKKQPFDLRLPNQNGKTLLGNCDGCFLKSESNRASLCLNHPKRARWWADQEKRFGSSFHVNTWWEDLIDYVEKTPKGLFDCEDYFCQADGGECTG